jgi:hypothetical protein
MSGPYGEAQYHPEQDQHANARGEGRADSSDGEDDSRDEDEVSPAQTVGERPGAAGAGSGP